MILASWKETYLPKTINKSKNTIKQGPTQPAIACSKLTIETLEQGVKYVQS